MTDILARWPGRPFLFSGPTKTHDAYFWLHLHHTLTSATGSAAPRSPLLLCLHYSTVPPRLAALACLHKSGRAFEVSIVVDMKRECLYSQSAGHGSQLLSACVLPEETPSFPVSKICLRLLLHVWLRMKLS